METGFADEGASDPDPEVSRLWPTFSPGTNAMPRPVVARGINPLDHPHCGRRRRRMKGQGATGEEKEAVCRGINTLEHPQ